MDVTNVEGLETISSEDIWSDPKRTAREIKEKHKPVNYAEIIGDARIIFLAENHDNQPIRQHLASHAEDLRAAGITHYAIEANEQGNEIFDKLNSGEQVDLSSVDVGPGTKEDYGQVIRAMAAAGIKIVAIDIDQHSKPTREERETRMTENLQRILQENPDGKIAYLVGGFHTSKRPLTDGVTWTGRKIQDAGVEAVTAYFAGGKDDIPRIFTDVVRQAELASIEFSLDMRPYASSKSNWIPYGAGETDYIIHLPQQF